jgi:hypothetical protein
MFNFGQDFTVHTTCWDGHKHQTEHFAYGHAMRYAGRMRESKTVCKVEVVGENDRLSYATLYGKTANAV